MKSLILCILFVSGGVSGVLYADDVNSLPVGTYIENEGPLLSPDNRSEGAEDALDFNTPYTAEGSPDAFNKVGADGFQGASDGSYMRGGPLFAPGDDYAGDGNLSQN